MQCLLHRYFPPGVLLTDIVVDMSIVAHQNDSHNGRIRTETRRDVVSVIVDGLDEIAGSSIG
jgi:hypothetical protein